MKTSESIIKFAAAFAKAQGEIGSAHKDAKNPHFGSKYADLASVTDAIRPAAAKHGIAFFQDGTLVETNKILLTTRVIHESGEWVEHEMLMPVAKVDPQGFGSAMTYARRYALQAAFGVAPAEDDGNAATGTSSKAPYTPSTPAKAAYKPAAPIAVAKPPAVATPAAVASTPPANLADMVGNGEAAAKAGLPAYQQFWTGLTVADKNALGTAQHEKWKATATAVKIAA